MMKVNVDKARVFVRMRNKTEGSVLQGTVNATCLGFEMRLELESAESPERIRDLLRNAEQGCFTLQALARPVEVTRSVLLNGVTLTS